MYLYHQRISMTDLERKESNNPASGCTRQPVTISAVKRCAKHPLCPWKGNYVGVFHDATCSRSHYHFLHNGEQNKPAEQNKGKAPLGEAVTRLWSYLTFLQRDRLWCSENSSWTVTYSPGNNCQKCSWAPWLPWRQYRFELLLFFVQNVLPPFKLLLGIIRYF